MSPLLPADVGSWSTEEVERYFESTGECSPIASVLRDQEIDGEALLLLSHDSLVKCLGMKLGPALKVGRCGNVTTPITCLFLL